LRRRKPFSIPQSGGSYAKAAALLGIHPNNLHRLSRNIGLKSTSLKQ